MMSSGDSASSEAGRVRVSENLSERGGARRARHALIIEVPETSVEDYLSAFWNVVIGHKGTIYLAGLHA